MTDIKIHTVYTTFFHFMIYSSGNNIPGGQLTSWIKILHKGGAIWQNQPTALTS